MLKSTSGVVCALTLGVTALGCSSNDRDDPSAGLPSTLTAVATLGFERPTDAVASNDGTTFYFTGVRPGTDGEADEAAVFSVPVTGGSATPLHAGAPLGSPTGLVLSCDGSTLYVADMGQAVDDEQAEAPEDGELAADAGALFTVDVQTGAITPLTATGVGRATGVALSVDCSTLFVTGWTPTGEPALFTVATAGGTAQSRLTGAPLVAPTGVHVDNDGIAWVMDYLAEGQDGAGALFAIEQNGNARVVISDLDMGMPGGVSLDSTGRHALMPTVDEDGAGQLTAVTLATGEVRQIPAPMMRDPAGIRTARDAAIFAVVDADSNTIFAAQ